MAAVAPDADLADAREAVAAFVRREMADAFGAANALLREVAPPVGDKLSESGFIGYKMHTLWLGMPPQPLLDADEDSRLGSLSAAQLRNRLDGARTFYGRMCRDLLDLLVIYGREKDPVLAGPIAVWCRYNGRADAAFAELTERPALRELGRRHRGRWTEAGQAER